MKTIKLETHDQDGNVIGESILSVNDGDKIILQTPEHYTIEAMSSLHHRASKLIGNDNANVFVLPDDVKIKIMKIN